MNTKDYDGDEINYTILLDNNMAEEFKTLEPFWNAVDLSKPYAISGDLTLLAPANNILSNYLQDKSPDTRVDTISAQLEYS